ncbi:hypothetical protein BGW80DRAFT_1301395 [Lactifluus volemus]|nr:hypothetical protein BGW80DRAFT_1301395 [Lactifluus volemus]
MSLANHPGTVQDSKAKRQEHLKSCFRDLGSIFVPSEGNVLADIPLSRGANGESPIKKRASRKSAVTPKSLGKENKFPGTKTSRGRLKTPKLQESKTNDGPSFPRVSAQRMPSDQLAAAINSTKTSTPFPTS